MLEDIKIAQQIIENSYINVNRKKAYHEKSFIYQTTNEEISSYQHHLKNKEKVLSVIASSNQILNTILEGTTEIDGYDISCFPKYYLYLHLAAIEELAQSDYMEFFYSSITTDEKYDDIFYTVKKNLPPNEKKFWEELFHFYDWYDIINSTLFSSSPILEKNIIEWNKYLQVDNYSILKEKIKEVNLNCYQGDVQDIAKNINKKYDLINLSSIIYYKPIQDYKKLLNILPLTDQGEALTYLYLLEEPSIQTFKNENCTLEPFQNSKSGIMIYQKRK